MIFLKEKSGKGLLKPRVPCSFQKIILILLQNHA